jgi:hypothetical protein
MQQKSPRRGWQANASLSKVAAATGMPTPMLAAKVTRFKSPHVWGQAGVVYPPHGRPELSNPFSHSPTSLADNNQRLTYAVPAASYGWDIRANAEH